MEKRKGVIKSISKKAGGKMAFCLDGSEQWYNGFEFPCQKGDTIKFDLEINGTWYNHSNGKVIVEKQPEHEKVGFGNGMTNRDELIIAQVILKGAIDLTVERLKKRDMTQDDLGESLCAAINELVPAFKLALHNLTV